MTVRVTMPYSGSTCEHTVVPVLKGAKVRVKAGGYYSPAQVRVYELPINLANLDPGQVKKLKKIDYANPMPGSRYVKTITVWGEGTLDTGELQEGKVYLLNDKSGGTAVWLVPYKVITLDATSFWEIDNIFSELNYPTVYLRNLFSIVSLDMSSSYVEVDGKRYNLNLQKVINAHAGSKIHVHAEYVLSAKVFKQLPHLYLIDGISVNMAVPGGNPQIVVYGGQIWSPTGTRVVMDYKGYAGIKPFVPENPNTIYPCRNCMRINIPGAKHIYIVIGTGSTTGLHNPPIGKFKSVPQPHKWSTPLRPTPVLPKNFEQMRKFWLHPAPNPTSPKPTVQSTPDRIILTQLGRREDKKLWWGLVLGTLLIYALTRRGLK